MSFISPFSTQEQETQLLTTCGLSHCRNLLLALGARSREFTTRQRLFHESEPAVWCKYGNLSTVFVPVFLSAAWASHRRTTWTLYESASIWLDGRKEWPDFLCGHPPRHGARGCLSSRWWPAGLLLRFNPSGCLSSTRLGEQHRDVSSSLGGVQSGPFDKSSHWRKAYKCLPLDQSRFAGLPAKCKSTF